MLMPNGYGRFRINYFPHMQTDSRGRALPWDTHDDPDEPRVERFIFTDPDFELFEFIDRHGFAASHYIIESQKKVRRASMHIKNRLTEFCKGSKEQGKILYAPDGQFDQRFAHARHKVYGLTPYTKKLLAAERSRCPVQPTPSSWFRHQLMQACVAESFELTAEDHGLRYVPRSEVLLHKLSGTARTSPTPMAIPLPGYDNRHIVPDDVFALESSSGAKRFFLVEVDRDTESMNPRDAGAPKEGATYFGKKLDHYDALLSGGHIRRWLGVSKPRILIATPTAASARQIMAHIDGLSNPGYFSLFVLPDFGKSWRVPDHILRELMEKTWMTVTGPKLITQP